MRILLIAVGTTGDVLPFIALGAELNKRGHSVTINTHDDFEELVRSHKLDFKLIGGSFKELAESKEGKAWLESGDNIIKYMSTAKRLFKPIFSEWVKVDKIIPDYDAVVLHPFSAYGYHTAEKHKIPVVVASLIPWFISGGLEPILVPFVSPVFKSWVNKTLNNLTIKSLWSLFKDLSRTRRKELGLAPTKPDNLWFYLHKIAVPHIHLYSSLVLPEPRDLPRYCFVTGFCFINSLNNYTPPPALVNFLSNGKPPVYIGFGSMTGKDPAQLTNMTVEAVKKTKQRAVLLTGWGGMENPPEDKDILIIDSAPHDWLFPKMKAVIHHGGIGTTAAGLRAGKPTGIVAFFGDQPFWGRRVQSLQVGPKPMVKKDLNVNHLASLIKKVCNNPQYKSNAQQVGEAIRKEQGAKKAADIILHFFDSGKLHKAD
ncbi:MAG: glycosyltransferase family 1 protein [Spirochaetales bacterium]|nr:glycosyltransferase family 1 protein [Spirochaetales bacterium]